MISISAARTAQLGALTDNPFFGWENLAAGPGVTYGGASTLADGAAANAFSNMTTEYWRPNLTGTQAGLWVVFPTAIEVKFAAIAAHNLGTLLGTVVLQYSTDGGTNWFTAGAAAVSPSDNAPIAFRVARGLTATHWRFWFTGLTVSAPLYVGIAHMGTELVMPQRFYADFAPAITPTEVELQTNVTDGGNLAGAVFVSQGSTLKAPFRDLDPSFIRGDFRAFQRAWNLGRPAFFAWRPATFAEDIHFAWRQGDTVRPSNTSDLDLMSVEVNMRVHEA